MIQRGRTVVHNEHVEVCKKVRPVETRLVGTACRNMTYPFIWPGGGGTQDGVTVDVAFLDFANLIITPMPRHQTCPSRGFVD